MQLTGARCVRDARWKLTGDGALFDLKNAPFEEIAVAADTTDPDARAHRESLQAVLADLKSQDAITGDTPPRVKGKNKAEKRKKKKANA